MTPQEKQARADEAWEEMVLLLMLRIAGLKEAFWRLVPHRHTYETRLVCDRCYRSVQDLFRKGRRL